MTDTNNNWVIVETGLTGKKAYEVLRSVEGQLSDGMWENSTRMNSYWEFENVDMIDDRVVIKIKNISYKQYPEYRWSAREKKRVIYKYNYIRNAFMNYGQLIPTEKIKSWFADKAKYIVKAELNDSLVKDGWKRDNNRELAYMGYDKNLTVADVYRVYDILKERKSRS